MRSDSQPGGQTSRSFIEQARRGQIIEAAIDVLHDGGFEQASLAAIAARAGISKGVISYHFAGKTELMYEVVARVLGTAERFMAPRVIGQPSWSEALRQYLAANLEFLSAHPRETAALSEALTHARAWADGTDPYAAAHAAAVGQLADLLAAGQRAGDFRPFSVRVMAISIRAAIDVVPALLRSDPGLDAAGYAAELVALFDHAVGAADRPAGAAVGGAQ